MAILALLPGLLAAWLALTRSPQLALINVYLPSLLLFPDYYRWIAPGLPDPTANQAAAMAIFLVWISRQMPGYRYSWLDGWVAAFASVVAYSEYRASGYADAQNLMFTMLSSVLVPYLLGKSLIEPFELRVVFVKRIVVCLSTVAMICLYEMRFGTNPWQLLFSRFFPGQGLGWVVTFRWGAARSAGPFGHAILAGIMMVVGYRLQRWLEWSGAWDRQPPRWSRWWPWPKLSSGRWYSLIMLGGVVLTLVKGPWLAGIIAAVVTSVGRLRQRWIGVSLLLGFIGLVCLPAFIWFIQWAGVGRENAKDDNQETAAYRLELLSEYMDIAMQQALWGWGLTKWPQVDGMPSIDNYYLLLLLMHGTLALSLFLGLLLLMLARLLTHALTRPNPEPLGSSLAFTLAGAYVAYMISVATVYMGLQTMPFLFLLTGWAESYLHSGRESYLTTTPVSQTPAFRFRRILR